MARALVVTRREALLPPVLAALAGSELAVDAVSDGLIASQRIARERYDLAAIDLVSLPTAEMASLPPLRAAASATPLLAVVGEAPSPALRLALELPVDALLLDPIDLHAGSATLRRLLGARAAARPEVDPLDGLSTFLKGLAHEILNPLTPIAAFLQILQRDPALTPEVKARYERMAEGTRRIEKTVHDLEFFARVRKPQRALLDLVPFLREQVDRWRGGETPLAARLETPPHAPLVLADREQIGVAFRQLAHFAAAAGKGEVDLELRAARGALEISVTGHVPVRLPPRSADALLPYHDVQGSGRPGSLDLAAAWGILRSHRATLAVEAQADAAVRFTVRFPTAPLAGDDEDEAR